jgi:hypothetical protein
MSGYETGCCFSLTHNDIVWCTFHQECIEKDQCKKNYCEQYSSKSGRGVCESRGKLFLHGEEVEFDVPQI